MYSHFKADESERNISINEKLRDTQNIALMVNVTIRRENYSVYLNCLTDSVSQGSYFCKEVLEHLKCDPETVEDVVIEVVTFVGMKGK